MPRRPESTLRSYVTRLRQTLDPDRDLIPSQRPGYRLDLASFDVDAAEFDDELERASAHLRAGDASTAASLLVMYC